MANIKIYVNENQAIEGIKLRSGNYGNLNVEVLNEKKERFFGKTDQEANVCSECEITLEQNELITGISYRKSTAGVGNILNFYQL